MTTEAVALPLPPAPRVAVRSAIARGLFLRSVRRMPGRPLAVRGPDGRLLVAGAPGAPELSIVRDSFFGRLGASGKIGFGEAYMAGDWTTPDDLAEMLAPFAANLDRLLPAPARRLRALLEPRLPRSERNTVAGAASNIRRHYDLSNDLFELFLDETMTYSCAIFSPGDSLADAQRRKLDAIAQLAEVRPGDRVLEIGTGWGALAIHLATVHGCRVTTITISDEQRRLAQERVAASGVSDLVDVRLCDYRRVRGRFDRIVSVEMLEAVGEEYWPEYFAACDHLLAPGGRAVVQTITMPHRHYMATRRSYGFIHKYVFPGGLIPSLEALDHALRSRSLLRVRHREEIGPHYAATLREWRRRFTERRSEVAALGFGEPFQRMWEFYLAYCEAGFASGRLGDSQLVLERT